MARTKNHYKIAKIYFKWYSLFIVDVNYNIKLNNYLKISDYLLKQFEICFHLLIE